MKKSRTYLTHESLAFQNRTVFWLFLKIGLPSFLVTAMVFGAFHYIRYNMELQRIASEESNRAVLGVNSVVQQFSSIITDLQYLGISGYLNNYLQSRKEKEKDILALELLTLTRTKKVYDQIRFLNSDGDEVIRVNGNFGQPVIVADADLQNKKNRYYFRDTMLLDCKGIFVSPLDLNMENGAIERPLKPMLRFGMPICDSLGKKEGVILFNYLGSILLGALEEKLGNGENGSQPMLLNNKGYWFLAPDPEKEWGFMFAKDLRFQNDFPDVWKSIQEGKKGQLFTSEGLFTFQTIFPLATIQLSNSGYQLTHPESSNLLGSRKYYWVLVLHVPRHFLAGLQKHYLQNWLLQIIAVSAVMLPLTWLFSREKTKAVTAQKEVQRSEEFTLAVTSQLGEGIIVLNTEQRIVMVNPQAQALLGWGESHLLGANINTVFPPPEGSDSEFLSTRGLEANSSKRFEPYLVPKRNGVDLPVSLTISSLYIHGKKAGCILTFRDISERLAYEQQLEKIAIHDPLTGAKNRGELERILSVEFNRSERYGESCAALLVDLDNFKNVNDTHGHQVGDRVLKHICGLISDELRKFDIIGRYGGEEFVIVLPEGTMAEARHFALRILEIVRNNPFVEEGLAIPVSISLGLACYPESGSNVAEVIGMADKAMYQAKKQGRDRFVCASDLTR